MTAAHPIGSTGQRPLRLRRGSPRMGVLGAAILIAMFLACVLTLPYTLGRATPSASGTAGATVQTPQRYDAPDLSQTLLPPFWAPHRADELQKLQAAAKTSGAKPRHWLGTDHLGRDLLVRCLAGGGISLSLGLAAALISVIIGTLYGSFAGYSGGRTDAVMMRVVDVLYGLPYILLVVLLAVAVDGLMEADPKHLESSGAPVRAWAASLLQNHRQASNVITLLLAIGGVSWLTMARVIRGQVLSLKAQPFMEAARAIGVPLRIQFTRHLLPNLLGPIIVYATLTVPAAILSESFLSFLGIGVKEPLPSWGNLAADGLTQLNNVRVRWWLLLWPCLLIAMTLLALNFLGEGLRERYDPKRRI